MINRKIFCKSGAWRLKINSRSAVCCASRFTYRDDGGTERRLDSSVVDQLKRWLLEQAGCRVSYTWEDMGELFWPRWVRHGRCDALAVCSWPPGMYCAPAPTDTLRLLHWQCRRRGRSSAAD